MTMLTVRNLDKELKTRLRIKAAQDGCSMEEEVRRILRDALWPVSRQKGLGSRLHQRIITLSGGGEFELPARSLPRPNPFEEQSDT